MCNNFVELLCRRKKLIQRFFLLAFAKLIAAFVLFRLASRYSYAAQVVDFLGLPSTVYMSDMRCNKCNSFNSVVCVIQPNKSGNTTEKSSNVLLLNLVLSHVDNFDRRQAVRATWGSVKFYRNMSIQTYFILGSRRPTSNAIAALRRESSRYDDIVQLDLQEDYRYLTNKTMAALHWATSRYPDARFLVKSDDDSFNAIERLAEHLIKKNPRRFVGGMCSSGEPPNRNIKSKWHVSKESYPGGVFPIHAKGRLYAISLDAAEKILTVGASVQFNAMEDIYVTGFCRSVAGLRCSNIPQIPSNNKVANCNVALSVINVHHVTPDSMTRLWNIYVNETTRTECKAAANSRPRST